jgi:hypothetical protein
MISRIFAIHKKYPAINLAEEESYFRSLQK